MGPGVLWVSTAQHKKHGTYQACDGEASYSMDHNALSIGPDGAVAHRLSLRTFLLAPPATECSIPQGVEQATHFSLERYGYSSSSSNLGS